MMPSAHRESGIQTPRLVRGRRIRFTFGPCAGLVLVLLLMAACTGVTVRHEPDSVGQYAVQIKVDPPSLQRGQKATISYALTNQATHKAELNLPVVNGATVHTTLVNHDLTWFRTAQASGPVAGAYPVNLIFADTDADSYRLYTEFTSGYTPTTSLLYTHTLSFGQSPPSLEEPAPLVASTNMAQSFFGVVVALDTGGALRAGQPATFHYTLSAVDSGKPVQDVNEYDGGTGHLYIISADGEEFQHLIMPWTASGSGAGPDLTFQPTIEKPGLYKTWLQFLYHGQVVTAGYVVNVTQ